MIEHSLQGWVMAKMLVKYWRFIFWSQKGLWLMDLKDKGDVLYWQNKKRFVLMYKMAQKEWWLMTVESVRLTWLLLPSLEDLLKKQERRTELSVSWEASIECQSRWKVNFSKISSFKLEEVHIPAPGIVLALAFKGSPKWSKYFCSCEAALCSWSSSRSLAAARAGGAGSPLNFLFLVIKAASPHNQCSQ